MHETTCVHVSPRPRCIYYHQNMAAQHIAKMLHDLSKKLYIFNKIGPIDQTADGNTDVSKLLVKPLWFIPTQMCDLSVFLAKYPTNEQNWSGFLAI